MANLLLLRNILKIPSGKGSGKSASKIFSAILLKVSLLIAGMLFSFSQGAYAQVTYSVSGPIPHTTPSVFLRTIADNSTTGATNIHAFNAGGSGNTWSAAQTLPFAFNFFGTPVTSYVVNKNGLLSFDASLAGTTSAANLDVNTAMPNANLPANTIAYFWGDFASPVSGDNIWAVTYGTAPNRQHWVFTFSYTLDVNSFTYNAVVLEETTNKVYVVDMYNSAGGTYTVGVQKDATTAVQVGGSPNIALINTATGNADNDYYLFTPRPIVATDAGAIALVNPVSGVCYSASQPVEVTIKNFGTSPLTNIPVAARITGGAAPQTITGTFTGTLAPNATANVVVGNANMAAAGTYSIKAYTALGTDLFLGNDTLLPAPTFTVTPTAALPQAVDFTGFTGSNLATVFPGWVEMSGTAPSPSGTTSTWTSDDFGNVTTHANGTAAKINLDAASDNAWIVSPKISATASTALKFDLALTAWNGTTTVPMGSDDQLRVMVSTDCGNTFTPIRTYDATTPISNTGQAETVSLAAYAGQDIILALYATEGTVNDPEDNDLFIDNLFLGTPPTIDMGATALVSPAATGCFTATEPVIVTIQNFGPNTVNFATTPTTVTVNVTGAVTQTLTFVVNTGTLASGATMNVTVGNLNMTATGTYTFNGSAAIAGDGNPANNNFSTTTLTVDPIVALPLNMDFTGFTGSNLATVFPGWKEMSGAAPSPSGTTSNWTSDDFINNTTHANGTAAKINLDAASDNVWIVSPKITPTATTALKFDLALTAWNGTSAVTMGSDDELRVMVSTNCGNTFTAIQTYNATTPISNVGQKESVSLAAYAGQNIIVALYATEGTVNDPEDNDLFIDNLFLGTPPAVDLAATVLVSPNSTGCFSATEPVIVSISNFGTNPVNFATTPATITVNVTGAGTQTLTFPVNTGTLAPNASQNVTVGTLNMSANGTYTFNGSVAITGDGDAGNNSFPAVSIFNGTIATFPALQDFETFTPIGGVAAGNEGWTGTTTGLRWQVEEGPTTSTGTGPSVDHTSGTATGNYVYLETSSGATGDEAELITPCINLTGQSNMMLEFWYHMFGATIDTLKVDIFNGTTFVNNVLVIGGQQQSATTDPWLKASVNLSAYSGSTIKVRFRGKRGTSFTGDIAIDDVAFVQMAVPTLTAGGPTTFCTGGSVVLTAASTTPGATIAFAQNGVTIPGTTGNTFTATASGSYTAVVNGVPSTPVVVTVNPPAATPTVTAGGATTFCQGGSVALTAASATTGATFQWFLNGTAIPTATTATITAPAPGSYTVVATAAGCPSAASTATTVTVNPTPATPTISQNGGILTSSSATGNQWFLNGTPIAGATGQTYITTANGNYTLQVTANGCPSALSAVRNVTTSGMTDNLAGMSVQVYPNPASGSFNVKLNGYQKEASVVLYNLAGQLNATNKVAADGKAKNIDIKGLAAGTYMLKVTSDKGVQVTRLVVQ